jgi:pilus assembly protein Flp/PilA
MNFYRLISVGLTWLDINFFEKLKNSSTARPIVRQESGQGLVEYASLILLVAIVALVVIALAGPGIGEAFLRIRCAFNNLGPCADSGL